MITHTCRKYVFTAAVLLTAILLQPFSAHAGIWQVIPIRVDLDQKSRSGVITVRNDAEEKLIIRAEAFEWVQNEEGKDAYVPSDELIFFPKVLTVNPKEERVIRIGIRAPEIKKEKTYRLFLKEEAAPQSDEANKVVIAIQFGLPIFSKPAKEEVAGTLQELSLRDGHLNLIVNNTGNTHFRINTVALSGVDQAGVEQFTQELNGWYLLSGGARTYAALIPEDICRQLKVIQVQVNADRLTLSGKFDVQPDMCAAQ